MEVLTQQHYTAAAHAVSRQLRVRPRTPLQEAAGVPIRAARASIWNKFALKTCAPIIVTPES